MIYFVTNRNHSLYDSPTGDVFEVYTPDNIIVVNGAEGLTLFEDKLREEISKSNQPVLVAKDKETSGLNPHFAHELFEAVGFEDDTQFVFDSYSIDYAPVQMKYLNDVRWLGQNLKFDCKFDIVKNGFMYPHCFDVMLADQRLFQNVTTRRHNLVAILENWREVVPPAMNKETRMEFIGLHPSTYSAIRKHVEYAAADVGQELFRVARKQIRKMNDLRMKRAIGMEFRKLPQLATSEVIGIDIDSEKWLAVAKQKEQELFEVERKLDLCLQKLVALSDSPFKEEVRGGKFSLVRSNVKKQMTQMDLFGNMTLQTNKKDHNRITDQYLKHHSGKVAKRIFGALGWAVIDEGGTVCRCFKLQSGEWGPATGITFGSKGLKALLEVKPDHPGREYIELLLERSSLAKSVSTYGAKFLKKYINKKTGRIHTQYRQARAVTSRIQSGDTSNGHPNMQNIPADPEYREPFHAPDGCSLTTADLGGAELVIICGNSGSQKLLALSKKDMHSHFATLNWRDVYTYRAALATGAHFPKAKDFMKVKNQYMTLFKMRVEKGKASELEKLAVLFECTKKGTPKIRKNHKPVTFATIYQAHGSTLARSLNVSVMEGDIMRMGIIHELPKVFKYTNDMYNLARHQGYLIISERIGSRVWFPEIIRSHKYQEELDWGYLKDLRATTANIRIQGGQADMLKKATGDIFWYNQKHKLPCELLLEVHDEIVASQPLNMDGVSKQWKANPRAVEFSPQTNFTEGDMVRYTKNKEHHLVDAQFDRHGLLKSAQMSYPLFIKMTMVDSANWFLEGKGVTMDASFDVAHHWVKD